MAFGTEIFRFRAGFNLLLNAICWTLDGGQCQFCLALRHGMGFSGLRKMVKCRLRNTVTGLILVRPLTASYLLSLLMTQATAH